MIGASSSIVWTRIRLPTVTISNEDESSTDSSSSWLEVTNPSVPLPLHLFDNCDDDTAAATSASDSDSGYSGTGGVGAASVAASVAYTGDRRGSIKTTPCVRVLDSFVSDQEAEALQAQLWERRTTDSKWEGFDGPRRRVQQYSFHAIEDATTTTTTTTEQTNTSTPVPVVPSVLVNLRRRLFQQTGLLASHVRIEEYSPIQHRITGHGSTSTNSNSSSSSSAATTTNNNSTATSFYDPIIFSTFACPVTTKRQSQRCPCQSPESGTNQTNHTPTAKINSCTCFIAEIPLRSSDIVTTDEEANPTNVTAAATGWIQNWNQPANRNNMCWNLLSPNHATHVRLRCRTAIVKQGPLLWDWRSSRVFNVAETVEVRVTPTGEATAAPTPTTTPFVVRMVQFYNLPTVTTTDAPNDGTDDTVADETVGATTGMTEDDTFGYVPTRKLEIELQRRRQSSPPPLSDLLTIIVTTSPIKSNPSTEVIERAMGTFALCGSEFAYACRKVIVCDGFRTLEDDDEIDPAVNASNGANGNTIKQSNKISRRHTNHKQAMRSGIVNAQQAENYRLYKQRLRQLCHDAESSPESQEPEPSVFANTRLVELDERHGYGFALRHVLRNYIETPYVCVIQHDRTFMRPTPMTATLQAMWLNAQVKYVGFSMRSNLMYRDIFLGKYGGGLHQQVQQDWNEMVLYLPQLRVPSAEYGPDSASTRGMQCGTDKVRQNIVALAETYRGSAQASVQRPVPTGSANGTLSEGCMDVCTGSQCQLSLVPTLYWYDNVHVCETSHYRDFAFNPYYKMVTRGGFIEDKLSPVLKRTVERLGLKDGHSRFGCFLLDDHSGYFFTGHIDGGSYISEEERQTLVASQRLKPS